MKDLTVTVFVPGKPAGKGSYIPIVSKYARKSDGKHFVFQKNVDKKLAGWTERARFCALSAEITPNDFDAVELSVVFVFDRPKAHFGSGKNSDKLKPCAPRLKTTPPDLDKLERALFDALTGVAYKDDSQVVRCTSVKRYANNEPEGTFVTICNAEVGA